MAQARTAHLALLAATAIFLIAVQVAAPEPKNSLLWSELLNAGHAPLYGLVALAILQLLRLRGVGSGGSLTRLYFLALFLTVVAGFVAEGIQSLTGRGAETRDVAHDTLGAAAFLLAASAFDSQLAYPRMHRARVATLLLAALLLTSALVPLAGTVLALLRRDAAFPTICNFDSSWELRFAIANEADLERTQPPKGWSSGPSGHVARLAFHPGTWPGLSIQTLHPNWTGFRELNFEVYSELPEPIELVLSLHDISHHDISHGYDYDDRFNKELAIEPGANHFSIPLLGIQTAPRGREMDLSRMCGLVLFANRPSKSFVLYLDSFRLE